MATKARKAAEAGPEVTETPDPTPEPVYVLVDQHGQRVLDDDGHPVVIG